MIKITHIPKQFEEEVCIKLNKELNTFGLYYEIKTYGNGENHSPTFKLVKTRK